jgi:hypothetical protein
VLGTYHTVSDVPLSDEKTNATIEVVKTAAESWG